MKSLQRMPAKSILGWLVVTLLTMALAHDASAGQLPIFPGAVKCPAKIEWHLDPSVQVTHFSCDAGDHLGQSIIHYELEMRNLDKSSHCYRVQIVAQGESTVSEFVPGSNGPPAIYPGDLVKAKYTVPVHQSLIDELVIYIRSAPPY